jgi:hypothetical protein
MGTVPPGQQGIGVFSVATLERAARLSTAARESRKVWEADVETRDQEIGQLEYEGVGIREIARVTELSPGHVHRIVLDHIANRRAG